MRELASPLSEDAPSALPLVVSAADESGLGSVCYRYEVGGFLLKDRSLAFADATKVENTGLGKTTILFHRGPVTQDRAMNGVTPQSLLAVINDRLLQGTDDDESGLVESEVVKNLLEAIRVLNHRDARLQARATANLAPRGVPALH